jgi:hypothetical protein
MLAIERVMVVGEPAIVAEGPVKRLGQVTA